MSSSREISCEMKRASGWAQRGTCSPPLTSAAAVFVSMRWISAVPEQALTKCCKNITLESARVEGYKIKARGRRHAPRGTRRSVSATVNAQSRSQCSKRPLFSVAYLPKVLHIFHEGARGGGVYHLTSQEGWCAMSSWCSTVKPASVAAWRACNTVRMSRGKSHVTRHTSHDTRHTSHLTPHTSHVTPHTSNVTRHTSHVTRHTSPARRCAYPANRWLC